MKIHTHFILLILLFLLISCTAKKTTTERTVQRDTLQISSFKYVSQPISTSIVIDELCDDYGKPRAFKQLETSGENKASVRTENNTLILDLITGLSQTKTDTIYKSVYNNRDKEVDELRYKTPLWMWLALISSILINIILLRFTFFR